MTPRQKSFFELVDAHARSRYSCFLAEMDLRSEELGYTLCFRPLGGSPDEDSAARYACRYLLVRTEYVRAVSIQQQLPASLVEQLNAELSMLRQRIADAEGSS